MAVIIRADRINCVGRIYLEWTAVWLRTLEGASCSSSTTTWTSVQRCRAQCAICPRCTRSVSLTAPTGFNTAWRLALPPARHLRPCQRSLRRTSTSRSRSTPSWAQTHQQSRSKFSSPPPCPAQARSVTVTRSVERVQKRASNVLKLTQENEKLKEELKAMTARLEAAERRRQEIASRQEQQTQQQGSFVANTHPARSQGSS